jgi:membrane protease YdiL (CAAX protease family)
VSKLFQWRVNFIWFIAALIIPVILLLLGKWITGLLGLSPKQMLSQDNFTATLLTAFFIALLANPWEEIGWRGFALPRLQKKFNAFYSSIVVGIMWAFWHLPLFFWLDNPMSEQSFWVFLVDIIGAACIYTWLFNSSKGSVFLVALYHIAWNTFGVVITGVSETVLLVEIWIIVMILLIVFGKKNFSATDKVVAG